MATNVTFNGSTYSIPAEGDSGWGTALSNYFIAIGSGALQKTGGSFTLLSEIDFGSGFGLKSLYFRSRAANPSGSGIVRLGNAEAVGWRNAANTTDLLLTVNASNQLLFGGTAIQVGTITVSDTATIDLTLAGLDLTASIVTGSIGDALIASNADIAYSKLNLAGSIVDADVSASAAIELSKLATLTASRAPVIDSSGVLSASAVTDVELGYLSGVTSDIQGQLGSIAGWLSSHISDNSAHGVIGDVVGTQGTQTLSGKTLASPTLQTPLVDVLILDGQASTPATPAPGYFKAYVDDTTKKLSLLDSDGNVSTVGSGGTGTNFITNGDAEAGTTGWATYQDFAGAAPVDGAGGTTTGVVAISTSSAVPLIGNSSFLLEKQNAASAQGYGWSYDFDIDNAYQASVVDISFKYLVAFGTFGAGSSNLLPGDVRVWIYDKTNGGLIQPSSIGLLSNSASIADTFRASFQTASNSTSYRLILHIGSTSTPLWTLKVDGVSVSPSTYTYGTPITDWQSYTPAFGGAGTVSGVSFFRRRAGDTLQIRGNFTTGTPTAVTATITFGPEVIDVSKIVAGGVANQVGRMSQNSLTSAFDFNLLAIVANPNFLFFGFSNGSTNGLSAKNGSDIFATGTTYSIAAEIPILGWSSSVQMSDSADTRTVTFSGGGVISQAVTANTTNTQATAIKDSHNAWTGSTYVVPVAGDYVVSGAVISSGSAQTQFVYKNGTVASSGGFSSAAAAGVSAGSVLVPNCVAGDVLSLRSTTSVTLTQSNISIWRITGPSAIAASETIAASYYAPSALTYSVSGTLYTHLYQTKMEDTHGAYNPTTGIFTAPANGLYQVNVTANHNTQAGTTMSAGFDLYIFTSYGVGPIVRTGGALPANSIIGQSASGVFRLRAGNTVRIQSRAYFTGTAPILDAALGANAQHFSIARIGL